MLLPAPAGPQFCLPGGAHFFKKKPRLVPVAYEISATFLPCFQSASYNPGCPAYLSLAIPPRKTFHEQRDIFDDGQWPQRDFGP